MVERRSTASKGKNSQRAERLKRTFQSEEMHVFRMNGLTEEPARLFKIFKEKKGKETSFLSKRQIICLLPVSYKGRRVRLLSKFSPSTTLDTYTKSDFVV